MPLPKGLRFDDRIAPYTHPKHGAGHLFICQRIGHSWFETFIPGFKGDAKSFRAAHDTAYHNPLFKHVGFEIAKNIEVEQLCKEWKHHIEQMELDGLRSPDTTRHYWLCCARIVEGMHEIGVRTVRDIDPSRISEFVRWMRKNTRSKGASIVKTLSGLKTMVRWKGIPADWNIPHDEIRAERREKLDLDGVMIRRLIAAMPEGSIEQAIAYLKARTGARDVEIFKARKEEFDLDVQLEVDGRTVAIGVFRPVLKNKGRATKRRHVYVITSDAAEKIRPFVEKARRGGYVFTEATGAPVSRESMRFRVRAASKRAGLMKLKYDASKKQPVRIGALDSIAQIRSEIVTLVTEETSLREAADYIGHADESTTSRFYVKDRLTARKLIEKYRPAEIIARALPLLAAGASPPDEYSPPALRLQDDSDSHRRD